MSGSRQRTSSGSSTSPSGRPAVGGSVAHVAHVPSKQSSGSLYHEVPVGPPVLATTSRRSRSDRHIFSSFSSIRDRPSSTPDRETCFSACRRARCDAASVKAGFRLYWPALLVLGIFLVVAVVSYVTLGMIRSDSLEESLLRDNESRTRSLQNALGLVSAASQTMAMAGSAHSGNHADPYCTGHCALATQRISSAFAAPLHTALIATMWAPVINGSQAAAAAAAAVQNGSPHASLRVPDAASCAHHASSLVTVPATAASSASYTASVIVHDGPGDANGVLAPLWWSLDLSECGLLAEAIARARDHGASVAVMMPWLQTGLPLPELNGRLAAVITPAYTPNITQPRSRTTAELRSGFIGVGIAVTNVYRLLQLVGNPLKFGLRVGIAAPGIPPPDLTIAGDPCGLYRSPNFDAGAVGGVDVSDGLAYITKVPLSQSLGLPLVGPGNAAAPAIGTDAPAGLGTTFTLYLHMSDAFIDSSPGLNAAPYVVAATSVLIGFIVATFMVERKWQQERELQHAVDWATKAAVRAHLSGSLGADAHSPGAARRRFAQWRRAMADVSSHNVNDTIGSSKTRSSGHGSDVSPAGADVFEEEKADVAEDEEGDDGDDADLSTVDLSSGIVFSLQLLFTIRPLVRGAALKAIEQVMDLLSHTDELYAVQREKLAELDALADNDEAHRGWLAQGSLVGTSQGRGRRPSTIGATLTSNDSLNTKSQNVATQRYLKWTHSQYPGVAPSVSAASSAGSMFGASHGSGGGGGITPITEGELGDVLRVPESPTVPLRLETPPQTAVDMLADLDKYSVDILELARLVPRPLVTVVTRVLDANGTFGALPIPRDSTRLLVARFNDGYLASNPYHTATHAANVVWDCQHIVGRSTAHVKPVQFLGLVLAAAVHDYKHPGFTNNFVIQSSHPVAIAHNDQSPLENFHVAEAFRTAMEMGDNNPLDCLPPEMYTQLRQLMIKLVLATDVATHFNFISQLSTAPYQRDFHSESNQENRVTMMLTSVIMLGDIGHAAKEFDLHAEWSLLIREEFFRQGDEERSRGMDISPLCDRHTTPPLPESQLGFFDFVAKPLFSAVAKVPRFLRVRTYLLQVDTNRRTWTMKTKKQRDLVADASQPIRPTRSDGTTLPALMPLPTFSPHAKSAKKPGRMRASQSERAGRRSPSVLPAPLQRSPGIQENGGGAGPGAGAGAGAGEAKPSHGGGARPVRVTVPPATQEFGNSTTIPSQRSVVSLGDVLTATHGDGDSGDAGTSPQRPDRGHGLNVGHMLAPSSSGVSAAASGGSVAHGAVAGLLAAEVARHAQRQHGGENRPSARIRRAVSPALPPVAKVQGGDVTL